MTKLLLLPHNEIVEQDNQQNNIVNQAESGNWDTFEHILLFISLYVTAISTSLILNFLVDKWFPGVNSGSYTSSPFALTLLRGYMAALIVSFPLFSFFFLDIAKRTYKNPTIRNLSARKKLIYATLVITFIIVLSSIISTVYNFLSGNVNINFLLHLLVSLSISGLIFSYYLFEIKGDRKLYA